MAEPTGARGDEGPGNFVDELVQRDLAEGRHGGRLVTRFPPEPNGYLHIGHAKSILLNFGLAERHGGVCNLRFDDTNPEAEEQEFVESIESDIRWLGCDWGDHARFASGYFEQLYQWAEQLVREGLAYVDTQSEEEIRAGRGDFHHPGTNSPHRDRCAEENLALLREMRAGEVEEGGAVLRAKIDMRSADLKLRDPLMYRIRKVPHHRTGDTWCIYPMYDWAHGQSDAIEGVTHSICTLEFQNHRALYDWFLEALKLDPRPEQIEFGRLNLSYTVLSKRKLSELVRGGHVSGWDDPRMPTLAGMRRRGYTAEAVRAFCERVGVSRRDGVVDVSLLEHALREDLNARCPRVMAVLRPLELVIENFEEGRVEEIDAPLYPDDPSRGSRKVLLTRRVYVERDDFLEEAPKKWFRLAPGREVRLRYGCLVTCREVVQDASGEVVRLRCTWDPASLGGTAPDGRRVRGTLHWVPAAQSLPADVRLYDRLFRAEDPSDVGEGGSFLDHLHPDSLEVLRDARVEPSLAGVTPGDRMQFERLGYFIADSEDCEPGALAFNRTIGLRDSWARIAAKNRG